MIGPPTTLRHQIAELRRELTMRARVYPGMIGRGNLTADEAERRNRAMSAALKTLERLADEQFKAEAAAAKNERLGLR